MRIANFVKKAGGFVLCFILAFALSRYDMPLHRPSTWIIDYLYQIFSRYQEDIYEPDADPVTFISIIAVVSVYAKARSWLVKIAIRKLKR